ncbi:hypothetical protein ACLKA6_014721 [Drosophila palustris]
MSNTNINYSLSAQPLQINKSVLNIKMSVNRRAWTPSEESTLLRLWSKQIKTVRPGTLLLEISKELEVEFQKIGIEIPANDIKTRMRSLVWRYYHVRRCKAPWKYYKSMAIIMKSVVRDEEKMMEKWKICVRTLLSGNPDAAVKKVKLDLLEELEVTSEEIQSKIFSLTRKFREYQDGEIGDEQWDNALFEILEAFEATTSDQQPENIECSVGVEIFNDEEFNLILKYCRNI